MATLADPRTAPASGEVSLDQIEKFNESFRKNPSHRQAMNAVCTTPVSKVALSRTRVVQVDHSFSHHLAENKITSQKQSGRCWMFAALNTLRVEAIKNMNLDNDFELSQNYTLFWDKFEKANYFAESIFETLSEPNGSRILDWILSSPVQDGGQWDMFINLVKKYGVVPKKAMPETESSSATREMSYNLTELLRDYGCRVRKMHASGKSEAEVRKTKEPFLNDVYRLLCIHLGEPPKSFNLQWRDKDKNFHRPGAISPVEFYERYIDVTLDDMVCLIHDPRPKHRYNQVYTVNFLGNVVGGHPVRYLNVEMQTLKNAAIEQIKDGHPVWFGNDVGKHLDRTLGAMDLELFDYDLVYGTKPVMNKAERLEYGHSQMTHAMVFTGVDLDENGRSLKWRVENSWGEEPGDKGFMVMTDEWFDEYMYEVVVHKQFVPESALAALEKEAVGLDPWDPMGSLATT